MKKTTLVELVNFIEDNSAYGRRLKERFIDETEYQRKLALVEQGLTILGIPSDQLRCFKDRRYIILNLGRPNDKYAGLELPLYLAHKKNGRPIPVGLDISIPPQIRTLADAPRSGKNLHEATRDMAAFGMTPDLILAVHKSLMNARLEELLPDLLADIERMTIVRWSDARKKIPAVYYEYLSPPSLLKVHKKISMLLRETVAKYTEEIKGIELYSMRLKEQLNGLYLETNNGLREIVENDVEQGADIDAVTKRITNLFSRLERLFLGNIFHLKDYETRQHVIQQFFAEEEDLKSVADRRVIDRRKRIPDLFEEYLFFARFGPMSEPEEKIFIKSLTNECEELHRQKSKDMAVLQKFERKTLLGMEIDFEALLAAYHAFFKEIVLTRCAAEYLQDLVFCLPPRPSDPPKVTRDLVHFKTLALTGDAVLEIRNETTDLNHPAAQFVEAYRKCITVLVYDIRGSSYMGVKLHNALKEQRVKYKFAKEMSAIAKKYNGFALKDTGDGGIIWFSENSGSLYDHLYAESVTGKGMSLRYSIFSGADFELIPSCDAAKRAVLCARDMVAKAEEFIQANFMHYREWFAELTERTLEVDGITYALLPPEFRSLFRIGIGISSGCPDRDVVFAANSFGDPDLVGPILADAHLYSRERQPGRSVMICDLPTAINLLLNIENFDFAAEETQYEKYLPLVEQLRAMPHPYHLTDYNLIVAPRGLHILEELNKNKALADGMPTDIYFDDLNHLYVDEKKKAKIVFEILNRP